MTTVRIPVWPFVISADEIIRVWAENVSELREEIECLEQVVSDRDDEINDLDARIRGLVSDEEDAERKFKALEELLRKALHACG